MKTIVLLKNWVIALAAVAMMASAPSICRADDEKAAVPAKCSMWKITSPTATVYVVASMSGVLPGMYPLPKEMEEAFKGSAKLYVEVDATKVDPKKMEELIMTRGFYAEKDERTLPKVVGKENYDAIIKCMEELGMEKIPTLDKMKPSLIGTMLVKNAMAKAGVDVDQDLDVHYLTGAKIAKKEVLELDSPEAQTKTVSDLPDDLQVKMLKACLQEVKDTKEEMERMKKAWKSGDAKAMADNSMEKYPEMAPFYEKWVAEHCVPMTAKVEEALKGKDQVFMVIGQESLLGSKGILKMLEEKKYKVEQATTAAVGKPEI